MPTDAPTGYQGGRKKRPTTVVTVHRDGRVTAKGPHAAAAVKAAKKSRPRVEREVAEAEGGLIDNVPTAAERREHERVASREDLGSGGIGELAGDVGKTLLHGATDTQIGGTGGAVVRHAIEGEGKNLVGTVAEDIIKPKELRAPTAKELGAAATVLGVVGAGEGAGLAEKGASRALSAASDASTAEGVAKGASKIIAKVKAAPKQVVEDAKRYPKQKAAAVKSAPRRIKATAARAPELKSAEGQKAAAKAAAKTSLKHPVKTGVPAAAALPPGTEIDGFDPGARARAFLEGTADAVIHHPGETLATTGKGALGFLTAPVALAGAGVASVKEGSPKPLAAETSTLAKGTLDLGRKLASGDPREVEEATRKETGLVPFIPLPHVVGRLKDSDAYEGARAALRDAVESRRATTRDSRIAAEKDAQEAGEFVPRKKTRKIRHPVADSSRPGESYVLRRTGRLIERQRSRHHVSREVARMQEEGVFAGKRESESVAKPLRRSPGTDHSQQNDSDALAVILKHGLPLDHSALDFARRLKEGYGPVEHGEIPAGVHLDRHSVQWILDHPEMFQGKRGERLAEAVAEFDRQSKDVATSRRHRYVAQVVNLVNPILEERGKDPILLPEEKVMPETAALLPKRGKEWSRSEALTYAKGLKDKSKAKAIRESLDGLMKPPEHGGAEGGISTTRADAYTPQMEREFAEQASKAAKDLGLRQPSPYVADRVPKGLKGEDKAPDFGAQLPLRKIWPSRGLAARSGNAQSDFEHLIHSSIEAPRQRKAVVRGLNRIFDRASREVGGKRYLTEAEAEKAINRHEVPDGTVFLRTQALKSVLEGDHTLDSEGFRQLLEKEIEAGQAMASSGSLASEMKDLRLAKGEKFAPMDAAAINELMGHLQPLGKVTTFMAHGTNLATRTILNSPAFAAIQIPQEGLPLAAALGANVTHLPGAIANLSRIAELPAEDQAAIKAVVGSSVGVLGAPSTKALRADGYMDPIRAAGGTPAWRHAWNLVNGNMLGKFDRTRAGLFREIAADAKVEGDFRKAAKGFNVWRRGARNLFKGEEQAVDAMKGMNRAERMAYVSAHPVLGDKLMRAMNDMAGNWNSFTVFEKHFAPLTVFYPFQRYSVLWMLYHFPLDHPVVATALATLGQVNAQELRSIAAEKGAEPSILDYTMPVVDTGSGRTVLPAGQRIFPGLSTLQQAAVTGNPAQLIGEASPPLAIGIEAATGKSAYTGQDIGEDGWIYMLRQAGNLSPFARFIGIPDLGRTQSATSKAFEAEDPLRRYRSTVDPFIGQTAAQYAGVKRLEKEEDTAHDPNKAVPGPFDMPNVQRLLYGGKGGGPEPKLLPRVLKEIHEGEAAKGFLKAKTQPYYGEEHPFSTLQDELLKAVEDAWETGPNGRSSSSGGQYGSGSGQYSKGPGQYSKGPGQYSAGAGQYGG